MSLAFGLTEDHQDVKWFDTYDEAVDAHQKKSGRYHWAILVYGFAQRLCVIYYHPVMGYYPTGFVTSEGVDLLKKYDVEREIFGETS